MMRMTLPMAANVTPRLFARVAHNEESRVAHEEDSRVTADALRIFTRFAFDSSQIFPSCGMPSSIHNRRHRQHNITQCNITDEQDASCNPLPAVVLATSIIV